MEPHTSEGLVLYPAVNRQALVPLRLGTEQRESRGFCFSPLLAPLGENSALKRCCRTLDFPSLSVQKLGLNGTWPLYCVSALESTI